MNADKARQLLDLCEKYDYKPDQIHLTNLTDFLSENASQVAGICKTALASLTAEPGIFEWRFKETDCAPATGWIALPMERLEQAKQTFGDLVEYRFWFPTPPAQLLRPVDLSKCKKLWYDHDDLSAEIVCIPLKEIKKALRQQGYEVKS
ncbi:hypothetical protein QMZ93_07230 [Pantoea stewartii subsp. indologenes]|uniref:hypothetical protein n=1 Tax=Pantoea stewartii TaxID=66269 RepID=UPI0024DF79FE|nr:hypothetical protein [Pantoea stewartii]MDK2633134.1 hypothetical protein [Pantoea stewartii subsp. indologenes]